MVSVDLGEDPSDAFARLFANLPEERIKTALVHPIDTPSLLAASVAYDKWLIEPVLIGPEQRILKAAEDAQVNIAHFKLVDVPHSHAAAQCGVNLARTGDVAALMKGALHTNELMSACVSLENGLRTDRRMSHIFVMDAPAYGKWLLITDGALNIAPDLNCKKWIVQNAIDLAHSLGLVMPLVAIVSATEDVDPLIASTLDAAALCKMAERGQITGGIVDGPLGFDLAVSPDAAKAKQIKSNVAGQADILIVPNLESGNMLAKQLDYLAGAAAAGIVLGAQVPIILNSRADTVAERVASCALAKTLLLQKVAAP